MNEYACPTCGEEYEWVKKFNNGNPKSFLLPTCDCFEKEMEERIERWLNGRGTAS